MEFCHEQSAAPCVGNVFAGRRLAGGIISCGVFVTLAFVLSDFGAASATRINTEMQKKIDVRRLLKKNEVVHIKLSKVECPPEVDMGRWILDTFVMFSQTWIHYELCCSNGVDHVHDHYHMHTDETWRIPALSLFEDVFECELNRTRTWYSSRQEKDRHGRQYTRGEQQTGHATLNLANWASKLGETNTMKFKGLCGNRGDGSVEWNFR